MYFPDRGCVHTLLTLYVYATALLHKYAQYKKNIKTVNNIR